MKNKNKTPPPDWFTTSSGSQLFVWSVNKEAKISQVPEKFLVGGNQAGYGRLIKDLRALLEERKQDAQNRRKQFSLSIPKEVPSIGAYLDRRPKLLNSSTVSVQDLEEFLRKTISPFHSFHFYSQLELQVSELGVKSCKLQNPKFLLVLQNWEDIESAIQILERATFPKYAGEALFKLSQRPYISLAADWVGME